ncbi:hypothetical protein BGZ89_011974 [Linnemannia elongata]|nr:hypothetical protein BGZ89_011974 [Linnemannia elongata]
MTSNSDKNDIPPLGFKGSDLPPYITRDPPKILIIGAGLSGLFLGNLLEKTNIPYEIFERAPSKSRPMGSVMCLSAGILPAIEQIGALDDLMKFSKPTRTFNLYTADMGTIAKLVADEVSVTGYDRVLFARPELYNLLLSRIPLKKIHLSKKLMSFQQNHQGVMARFSDGSTIHGDVLVGADGAHSAVRHHLFKTLKEQNKLPTNDMRSMNKGYMCFLGTTNPLDPVKFPDVDGEESCNAMNIGDKSSPYTWVMYSVPGNRLCWNVVIQLELAAVESDQFRNSEWAPESNKRMLNSLRHFKTIYGTLGDIFDATNDEGVSRVFFEDMLYETWNHGRTVLIGDAAHKMLPSTGAGAINGMQDAVILANRLYDIQPTSFETIKAALSDYRDERFDNVKSQYSNTHMSARLQFGHTIHERIIRHVVFNWMPKWMQNRQVLKDNAFRPQVNFLPQVPPRGTGVIIPQRPSTRRPEGRSDQDKDNDKKEKEESGPCAVVL